MIKRFFYGPFVGGRGATGLLVLRVLAGLALMVHGFPKIQHPTNWMGPSAPIPGFLQFLGAFSEFVGGMALVAGLLTSLASLGIMATMLFAAFIALGAAPIIGKGEGPSKEPALTYFVVGLTLFLTGPGTLSMDHYLFGKSKRSLGSDSATR